ncbi:unnamed protein product [Mytilus coruscus]|uniref:TIR domain-containing protein n=1 Tax=Mytilus coruscus TaxID=42192 RepID=A0A6J8EGI1_MYTCO|nr:unnamed protein product [Mytilus coruscus]
MLSMGAAIKEYLDVIVQSKLTDKSKQSLTTADDKIKARSYETERLQLQRFLVFVWTMEIHIFTSIILFQTNIYISDGMTAPRKINVDPYNHSCSERRMTTNLYVDCSKRNFTSIPPLPKWATSVDLSNNEISMILFGNQFQGMSDLREIYLSDNPLEYVTVNLFKGLLNLSKLIIKNSLLYKQKTLVLDSLLAGLYNLKEFALTFKLPKNKKFSPVPCSFRYKSQPFEKIDALRFAEILEIDAALIKWQTHETSKMVIYQTKSLYLINGFVCFYGTLTNRQFYYMPFLEMTIIDNMFLTSKLTDDFITTQKHLQHLAIYGQNIPYGYAIDLIYNVTISISDLYKLNTLLLNGISNGIRLEFHCSLGLNNLTALNSLETVSMIGNSLSFNSAEECDKFPKSLQHLNLQNNCFSSYDINFSVLFFNKQIKTLNASNQNRCSFKSHHMEWNTERFLTQPAIKTANVYALEWFVLTNSKEPLHFGDSSDFYPNLTYMDLSSNNKVISKIPSFFSSCRPSMKFLNMSNCEISEIEEHSFSNFSKLEILDLSSNMLGSMGCVYSDRLKNLVSLRILNIADNQIKCSNNHTVRSMRNLQRINISNNELQRFDTSLEYNLNLEYIDLSKNKISKLSEDNMGNLDAIAGQQNVEVILSGNVLLCTCETLQFLQWMMKTKVKLVKRYAYQCSYSNGSITTLKEISHIYNSLNNECTHKSTLIIFISAIIIIIIACFLVMVSGILLYKFRWQIRYFYYKTKIKIPYKPTSRGYEQIFEYDVFISYASEDYEIARAGTLNELESKRGLRACIHERDFQPGESIALNISKGIRSSRRTILFVSGNFLNSEWCMYELNIARMESLHSKRKLILTVMIENISYASIPVDVLDIINTYTYLQYPANNNDKDVNVFWNKCAEFVLEN